MEFIDDLVNLAISTVFFGIITAIVFGFIFISGGIMIGNDKEDSKFATGYGVTIIVLFIIANIIGFIVNIKGLFFS